MTKVFVNINHILNIINIVEPYIVKFIIITFYKT